MTPGSEVDAMPTPIETFQVGDLTVHVDVDPEPLDPRNDDNLGTMVCLHRRYRLGDPHDYRVEDHSGWDDLRAHILRYHPRAVILPLYLFDHGGLTMSTDASMFRAFDAEGWDWGQVGFIYASAESIRAEYGVRRISGGLRERVEVAFRAEVEVYDRFLRSEVYAYVVEGGGGEVVDSCGGFVGLEHAIEEARSAAEMLG